MSQFHIPNRQRRKSNLGKRNRTNENLPRMAPVFAVPVARGLGRSKSAKKTQSSAKMPETPGNSQSLHAKKRLFLLSPLTQLSSYKQYELVGPSRIVQESPVDLPQQHSVDESLNETGVKVLVATPSPTVKSASSHNQTSQWETYLNRFKVEQPKSPNLSHYSNYMLTKLANLKPPVDPDDNIEQMKSLSLKTFPHTSNVEQVAVEAPSLSIVKDDINCSSSNINEDLDTTGSFILAEQTILDQNQTLPESPTVKGLLSASKSILKSSIRLEPVVEEEHECDSEDELLQQTLTKLNNMMVEIESTKKLVHSLIRRRKKCKTKVENKENVPSTASKDIKDKWMKELKSENPGLLKTPKQLSKERLSVARKSTWTPHSLSFVLNDQMDNLFE